LCVIALDHFVAVARRGEQLFSVPNQKATALDHQDATPLEVFDESTHGRTAGAEQHGQKFMCD
jgi:hypothetical protein